MKEEVALRKKQHDCKHPSFKCSLCRLYIDNVKMEQSQQIKEYREIISNLMGVIVGLENVMKMLDIDEQLYKNVIMYISHQQNGLINRRD